MRTRPASIWGIVAHTTTPVHTPNGRSFGGGRMFGRRAGKEAPEGVGGRGRAAPYYERASGNKPTGRPKVSMCRGRAPPEPDDASLPDRTRGQNTIEAGAPKDPGPKIAV
jgi:hypothetical protein